MQINKQESDLISILSHQLFSPLTVIKGYSSLLLEGSFGEISDKQRGTINDIFRSSQDLIIMIENFLGLSSGEKPIFYKFESSRDQNSTQKFDRPKPTSKKLQSEFASIPHEFYDLAGEIKKDATILLDMSFRKNSEEAADAIKKISESSENLVKTIKNFSHSNS